MIIAVNFQFKQLERRSMKKSGLQQDPVEAPKSYWILSSCLNWKLTAMIILHFHQQPKFKYELFHIYFTISCHVSSMVGPMVQWKSHPTSTGRGGFESCSGHVIFLSFQRYVSKATGKLFISFFQQLLGFLGSWAISVCQLILF